MEASRIALRTIAVCAAAFLAMMTLSGCRERVVGPMATPTTVSTSTPAAIATTTSSPAPSPTSVATDTPQPAMTATQVQTEVPEVTATPVSVVATATQPATVEAPSPVSSPTFVPATEVPVAVSGKVIGMWKVPKDELPQLTQLGINTVFYSTTDPDDLVDYLETAERLGVRVMASLVGSRESVDPECAAAQGNPRRCPFDVAAFRAALEKYRPHNLARFANTSFYVHMMLDEPYDESNWGGREITEEQIRQASAASREVLGDAIRTGFNAGYIPPGISSGLADVITSTFYANKESRFGPVEIYLADQTNNLTGARASQPTLEYIILLQAFERADRGGAFPDPDEMEAKAVAACQQPGVRGILWWTWFKPQEGITDFRDIMAGPEGPAYADMVQRVVAACAG